MNLHQKLIEVRKIVPYLQKENSGNQYNYVSSSQVLSNVITKLNELNVLLVPSIIGHNVMESSIDYHDDNGKNAGKPTKRTTTYFTEIDMLMTWVNAEKPDETIQVSWYGQGVDIAGEKGVGKALTYAEKYFILKFFNIATDKDDPDRFQGKNNDSSKENKSGNETNQQKNAFSNKSTSNQITTDTAIQKCFDCHNPIGETMEQATRVKDWCQSHGPQFKNKILCQKCQQNYKKKVS